jgi:hypothetical protein
MITARTIAVYTDPRLLDVAGALECLPALPVSQQKDAGVANLQSAG